MDFVYGVCPFNSFSHGMITFSLGKVLEAVRGHK